MKEEYDFTLCLGEEKSEDYRCLSSDTIYTVIFGVGCIVVGLIVSGILQLIESKRSKKEEDHGRSENGHKDNSMPENLQKASEDFSRESYARSSVNSLSSARKRAINGSISSEVEKKE